MKDMELHLWVRLIFTQKEILLFRTFQAWMLRLEPAENLRLQPTM